MMSQSTSRHEAHQPPAVAEQRRQPAVDLTDRTFLVTGASTGIGLETARGLASAGAQVVITARTETKARAALQDIASTVPRARLEFLTLDLGDLASVRSAAETFLASGTPLHGLINNAGLAGQRGLTASGFELHFGTNHVGPFLLTSLLLERLRASAPARIVNVSSEAHYRAAGIDYAAIRRPTRSRTGFGEYGVSKLANVLHAQELARRLDGTGVTTYALHPGAVASDVWRRIPGPVRWVMKSRMLSVQDGAQPSLRLASAPDLANSTGRYYDRFDERACSERATEQLAAELWLHSEEWTGA